MRRRGQRKDSVWNGVVWATGWETFRQMEPQGVSSWLVIKLVSRRQTPSQWDRLIKTVPPFIFGMLCHFENASTCITPRHPWDNLIFSINLSELELTRILGYKGQWALRFSFKKILISQGRKRENNGVCSVKEPFVWKRMRMQPGFGVRGREDGVIGFWAGCFAWVEC